MYKELKERVLQANLNLYKSKLAILTWGNVSEKSFDGNFFAIKPSGVSYEKMTVDDIVVLNMEGKIIEGNLKPSSDTPTHLELYKAFPNLKGIVHTHSPYGVAWAQTGYDIPCFGTTHADNFYGPIPCARSLTNQEIEGQYEQETGFVIIEEFKKRNIKPKQVPGILVKFHGPFAFSIKSGTHAVEVAQILEEVAKMALLTKQVDKNTKVIDEFLKVKHYERKHGDKAYYGQKKD